MTGGLPDPATIDQNKTRCCPDDLPADPSAQASETSQDTEITTDVVLAAALALVDRDGIEGLSMRLLARALGRDPMAPYRHALNKTAILDGVAAVDRLPAKAKGSTGPGSGYWDTPHAGAIVPMRAFTDKILTPGPPHSATRTAPSTSTAGGHRFRRSNADVSVTAVLTASSQVSAAGSTPSWPANSLRPASVG